MPDDILASLRHLSDGELVARVNDLATSERDATALLVAHLAELDTRDVHLRAGYGSLFAYCRTALSLSEGEAYSRIEAARAARRFPVILERLAEGAVNLTTVRLLAPHLTEANHREVLDAARGKGRLDVEGIVARLSPRPDIPPSLRRLPMPAPPAALPPTAPLPAASVPVSTVRVVTVAVAGYPGQAVAPLSPDRYRLQVTIGLETLEKLRLARDMLRHAIPSGDEAAVLDRALTALLSDLARKRFAAADTPRPPRGTAPGSRHIPAEVKRAVFLRDLGRCAFVGTGGRRCAERGFVEFHHAHPYAMGGEATVGNIQLRCRRHNDYEARADFGRGRPGAPERGVAVPLRRDGGPERARTPPDGP
jgi:hypothetical protein